jgi:1-acyl-sn-glycerol-3-phosphate acyltransferase
MTDLQAMTDSQATKTQSTKQENETNPYAKYAKVVPKHYTALRGFLQNVVMFLCSVFARVRYDLKWEGKENIPRHIGNYMIAANHTSNLDPPLVSWVMGYRTRIAFMAKKELYETFWGKVFCLSMGTFAVNRQKMEMATIRSCKSILNDTTWHLGIFPEGTRNKSKAGMGETKRGVGFIATMNKVPVLPIGLVRYQTQGKEKMKIRIGELIPYEEGMDTDTMSQKVADALTHLLRMEEGWVAFEKEDSE